MAVNEEINFLKSQLEGLESIFFELIPFGVPLKRRNIQDFYDGRFDWASKPAFAVSKSELRRQFNTKANQVRNIVDGAETIGNVQSRFNLVYAGGSLPTERQDALDEQIAEFCSVLVEEEVANIEVLRKILARDKISPAEARILLASSMMLVAPEITVGERIVPLGGLLDQLLEFVTSHNFLPAEDPFLLEAKYFAEGLPKA